MKRLVLAGCFIALTCASFAQDVIVTRGSRRINAIVTQVNVDNIRYKHYDNPNGSTYMLQKRDVVAILYQNGKVETFETEKTGNQEETSTSAQTQTQRTTQPNQYQPQNQRTMQPNQYNQYQDAVYLKNGSIIRGVIIEQIPNNSITIQTADGNVFVYRMDEIETIYKAPLQTHRTMQLDDQYYHSRNLFYGGDLVARMQREDPILFRQYQSGVSRGQSGWGLIGAGLIMYGVGIGIMVDGASKGYDINGTFNNPEQIVTGYIAAVAGNIFIIAGIPTAIVGKVRRVRAINAYQQKYFYGETKKDSHFKINLHSNGLGLAYVF